MLKKLSYKKLRKKSKVGKKKNSIQNNKKIVSRRMKGSKRVSRRMKGSKRVSRKNKFKMDSRRYTKAVTVYNKNRKQSGLDLPEEFYERANKLDEIRQLEDERKKLWAWNFREDQKLLEQINNAKMELQIIRDPINLESAMRSQEMHQHRKDVMRKQGYDSSDEDKEEDENQYQADNDVIEDMEEYDFCDSESDSDK
jgi:hypothetical protein